jgi:hypothetical protein
MSYPLMKVHDGTLLLLLFASSLGTGGKSAGQKAPFNLKDN